MYGYTGYYKDKLITVMSSGMGMPSMMIYASELFKFYDVKKIIRIGTCGTVNKNVKLLDVILALKKEAMSQYNYDIDSAIVAIPVGFSPEKREKIRQAARKAGIEIKTFISEPTAAFFANYKELKNAETVAVFDWGGGTLDVCVLRNDHGKVAELASKSLALAGDNIDEKLAKMGQDAINVINGFNNKLPLTGAILTKMDGNTKGGVALSVRHLTNIPIKFVGDSEKLDGLDFFDPERAAGRILGMGDIVSLVEKATEAIDEKEAEKAAKRMQQGKFDLEDFLSTMKQIKKLGPLENLLKLIPGAKKMGINDIKIDPKQMAHIEAIVLSMTPKERRNPDIIKASRKTRIASGSGTSVQEVNRLLQQFDQMKKMMKQMSNGNMKLPF